jgi:hypothetical protein
MCGPIKHITIYTYIYIKCFVINSSNINTICLLQLLLPPERMTSCTHQRVSAADKKPKTPHAFQHQVLSNTARTYLWLEENDLLETLRSIITKECENPLEMYVCILWWICARYFYMCLVMCWHGNIMVCAWRFHLWFNSGEIQIMISFLVACEKN